MPLIKAMRRGVSENFLNTVISPGLTSSPFAIPQRDAPGRKVSWSTRWGVNPATVNIVLEGAIVSGASNDWGSGTSWAVLDTTTAVTGETRFLPDPIAVGALRVRVVSVTGGDDVIVDVLIN